MRPCLDKSTTLVGGVGSGESDGNTWRPMRCSRLASTKQVRKHSFWSLSPFLPFSLNTEHGFAAMQFSSSGSPWFRVAGRSWVSGLKAIGAGCRIAGLRSRSYSGVSGSRLPLVRKFSTDFHMSPYYSISQLWRALAHGSAAAARIQVGWASACRGVTSVVGYSNQSTSKSPLGHLP
eukprot:scaffold2145_cov115-Pinguiococcus_pyrenoidosus.AAC.1